MFYSILLVSLFGCFNCVKPSAENEAPNNTLAPQLKPYCGEEGCYNGGKCVLNKEIRINTNHTGVCECRTGWTNENCSSCVGRVMLEASQTRVQTIHDGHGNYSSNALSKCSWLIDSGEKEKIIKLKLSSFETECGWDHLYIFDGTSALQSKTIGAYCGIVKQEHVLYAKSGYAFLHFYSDMAYNMSGFEVSYSLVDEEVEDFVENEIDENGNSWLRNYLPVEIGRRASISMEVVNDTIYMWGGYQFTDSKTMHDNRMWACVDRNCKNLTSTEYSQSPDYITLRYGGGMTEMRNNLVIYGGVRFDKYKILNDIWRFDLGDYRFHRVLAKKFNNENIESFPIPNSGHSTVKVTFPNSTSILLSIGGYAPKYGYMSIVQELLFSESMDSVKIRIPFTYGTRISGSFGHVSIVDQKDPTIVYVYGGFKNSELDGHLTAYNAATRRFSTLSNSLSSSVNKRWFHSGLYYDGNLVFMSGNTHSDTVFSTGTLCFSNDILVYSIDCKTWRNGSIPEWYPRYGSTSKMYKTHIISVGGFNGGLLNDIVQIDLSDAFLTKFFLNCDKTGSQTCEYKNSEGGCATCLNKNNFLYDKKCQYCDDKCSLTCQNPVLACDNLEEAKYACNSPKVKCSSCTISGCQYQIISSKDETSTQCSSNLILDEENKNFTMALLNTTEQCLNNQSTFQCGTFTSCEICTQRHNCMWCGILGTCVSNEAHVTSFPFGQCHEWFQKQHCYKTQCEGHLTCKSCQNDPRCGWCDDGTGTGSGNCYEGTLNLDSQNKCTKEGWFWIDCPTCNCSGHSKCDANGVCLECESFTTGRNCERCQDDYHGVALNNGTCAKCQCGRHGKSCDHTTGKCSCTTKGVTGSACDQCDKDGYVGNPKNSTCFYDVKTDFQYSFRMKPDIDKDVTKLNCLAIPLKAEPAIEVSVIIATDPNKDDIVNTTLSVQVNTTLTGNNTEENVSIVEGTKSFKTAISVKKYKFGPETNRTIKIYVYDFKTPLTIKVTVTQHSSMSLLTFFLVFFACFLSLLLIAVIVWKLKTMWDVQLQRRAVMNEMRQMAARPFATVKIELAEDKHPILEPSPACYEILDGGEAAVTTVLMLLPREKCGAPPVENSAMCFGSVMVDYNEKHENDILLDTSDVCSDDGIDNPCSHHSASDSNT